MALHDPTRWHHSILEISDHSAIVTSSCFHHQTSASSGTALQPGAVFGDAGSRLHDFGCRGCTCAEQTVLGGVAHLLNFDGTDTMSAAYYAQAWLATIPGLPVRSRATGKLGVGQRNMYVLILAHCRTRSMSFPLRVTGQWEQAWSVQTRRPSQRGLTICRVVPACSSL